MRGSGSSRLYNLLLMTSLYRVHRGDVKGPFGGHSGLFFSGPGSRAVSWASERPGPSGLADSRDPWSQGPHGIDLARYNPGYPYIDPAHRRRGKWPP
jgi:hypothetical protein